ncbi:TPR repeat-containing protein [Cryptosporidium serpentis]
MAEHEILRILDFLGRWQLSDHISFWSEILYSLNNDRDTCISLAQTCFREVNFTQAYKFLKEGLNKKNYTENTQPSGEENNNLDESELLCRYLLTQCCIKLGKIQEAENIFTNCFVGTLSELLNNSTMSPSISPKSWKGTPVVNSNNKTASDMFSSLCNNPILLIKSIHNGSLKIPGESAGLYLMGKLFELLDLKLAALYCYVIAVDWNPMLWKAHERLVYLSCQMPQELANICCSLNTWSEKYCELENISVNGSLSSCLSIYAEESNKWTVKKVQDGNLIVTLRGTSENEDCICLNIADFFYNLEDFSSPRQQYRYKSFCLWLESVQNGHIATSLKWPYSKSFDNNFKDSEPTAKWNVIGSDRVNKAMVDIKCNNENKYRDSSCELRSGSIFEILLPLAKLLYQSEWYQCNSVIKAVESFPEPLNRLSLVTELHVKALFESNLWEECNNLCSKINPHNNRQQWINCLDLYSSCLWQLKRSVELINLANLVLQLVEKDVPQLWVVIGNCFSLHREYESSIKCFKKAVQHNPGYIYAYTLIGHEFSIIEKYDEAIQMYQRALKLDPRCHRAHWGIGYVWFKREEYYQARAHFNIALQIVPNNSTLIHYLGLCYLITHDFLTAYNTFQKGILRDPRNPWLKYHAGVVLLELERYEEALTMLTAAHRLASNEPNIHLYLGKIYAQLTRKDKALRHLNIAFDLTKDINEKQIILNLMKDLDDGIPLDSNNTHKVHGNGSSTSINSTFSNKILSSFRNHHFFPIRSDPPNPFTYQQSQTSHTLPTSSNTPIITNNHSLLLSFMPGNNP